MQKVVKKNWLNLKKSDSTNCKLFVSNRQEHTFFTIATRFQFSNQRINISTRIYDLADVLVLAQKNAALSVLKLIAFMNHDAKTARNVKNVRPRTVELRRNCKLDLVRSSRNAREWITIERRFERVAEELAIDEELTNDVIMLWPFSN